MNNQFGFPNFMNNQENNQCCKPECPTVYKECPPIMTCSKQVIDQYHITKQPYIHTYHTEVVHHHVVENEFIPKFTCSEVHVNEPTVCLNQG